MYSIQCFPDFILGIASLILCQQKKIETRSWKTAYRGELYIHASQKKLSKNDIETQSLLSLIPNVEMQYGYIICKCNLVDCIYMNEVFISEIMKNNIEYRCGNFALGRYAWILDDIVPLEEPIFAKGQLSIWNYN